MPGVTCTVGEQIEALRRVAGDKVAARIRREPERADRAHRRGWPQRFDPQRALTLGFRGESSFEEIIRIHIDEDLGGKIAAFLLPSPALSISHHSERRAAARGPASRAAHSPAYEISSVLASSVRASARPEGRHVMRFPIPPSPPRSSNATSDSSPMSGCRTVRHHRALRKSRRVIGLAAPGARVRLSQVRQSATASSRIAGS